MLFDPFKKIVQSSNDIYIKIKSESDHYNLPLMIEHLVFRANTEKGGYIIDGDIKKILPLVRQAVGLGADIIKADPTIDVRDYHRVVKIAGNMPVLVRGGSRASDRPVIRIFSSALKHQWSRA